MNEFDTVKGADARLQQDIANWENKADDYVNELFDNEMERVYGTRFGDNLAIIADIAENAVTNPETFRGLRDKEGRLQAAAIVHPDSDYIEVEFIATAPWNILQNQPESLKGAGTSLIEELAKESRDLGFGGRLKLYAIPRARQFYTDIGFVETDEGDWELTPEAAERFLEQ
ncbi:MAG: GNAT family N-acetyltransferase [Rhizonema sp. PD37]|nr:GNAT family N-acetyltransferase [Rhizonema sp. PD37]